MEQSEYMSIKDAMGILKVGRLSIYRRIKEGKLIAYRVGRLIRITRLDLDEFVKGGRNGRRRRSVKA